MIKLSLLNRKGVSIFRFRRAVVYGVPRPWEGGGISCLGAYFLSCLKNKKKAFLFPNFEELGFMGFLDSGMVAVYHIWMSTFRVPTRAKKVFLFSDFDE